MLLPIYKTFKKVAQSIDIKRIEYHHEKTYKKLACSTGHIASAKC